jgi:hypothetical protein
MRVLGVGSHRGSAQATAPVLRRLIDQKRVDVNVFAHDVAGPVFNSAGLFCETADNFGLSDVSVGSMCKVLDVAAPDLILTGTLSQGGKGGDWPEQTVITAAHHYGVPTFGIQDVWDASGNCWRRFTDERGGARLALLPARLGVLDQANMDDLRTEDFPLDRLLITGNPHFDALPLLNKAFTDEHRCQVRRRLGLESLKTVLFYAGNAMKFRRSEYGYWDGDNIEVMVKVLLGMPDVGLVVRLHPHMPDEEQRQIAQMVALLAGRARLVKETEPDSQTCALAADATFGAFSTLLLEALFMGRPAVSLQPELKTADQLRLSRERLIPVAHTRLQACQLIARATIPAYRAQWLEDAAGFVTDGKATERAVAQVYRMLGL